MLKFTSVRYLNSHNLKFARFYQTQEVRVRFAPSPTGFLHLGGLRTALYNFLFAKSRGGKFILRLEDTDQSRLVEDAQKQLQEDLYWAGIHIDEGPNIGGNYGPYIQSQRLNLYKEQVKVLLNKGAAYYCFCTNKRLDLLRAEAVRARQIPKYDNRCRHLNYEDVCEKFNRKESCCIRFKLTSGCETFDDMIYGHISYDVSLNEGDPVIMKSDGYPTYHFANVVDDYFMKITHVLRGVEWQISTAKHIMLYKAFEWKSPVFGHLPLLVNTDGTKLSKRQGDINISNYKQKGIFPLALINFILHSGGGFSKDQEHGMSPKSYTLNELAQQFDIKRINSHSGRLMSERLLEFNQLELERQLKNEENLNILVIKVQNLIKQKFPDRVLDNSLKLDSEHIKSVLTWSVTRINKLEDLVSTQFSFLWMNPNPENVNIGDVRIIKTLQENLTNLEDTSRDNLNLFLKKFSAQNSIKFNQLMQLLRLILSGLKEGPGVAEMIEILGKENTSARLQTYIKKYNN